MKELFRDIIEQGMEVVMDVELDRERCQRSKADEGESKNCRNDNSKKNDQDHTR